MTKQQLSDVERQVFFSKNKIKKNETHTLLFFALKKGTRVPLVTIRRMEDDKIDIVNNPDKIDLATVIKQIKKSI